MLRSVTVYSNRKNEFIYMVVYVEQTVSKRDYPYALSSLDTNDAFCIIVNLGQSVRHSHF